MLRQATFAAWQKSCAASNMAAAVGTTGYPGCLGSMANQSRGECHVQPQNLLVARRRWHHRAPIGFRPAGVPEGRALCKCGGQPHALRCRCRERGVDQKRNSHAACRGAICLAACIETLYLYVASSSSASGYGRAGTEHHVTAFSIDPATGALSPHGAPIRLPTRPIHISTDIPSENILVAFKNPSALRGNRIKTDFTPDEEVT